MLAARTIIALLACASLCFTSCNAVPSGAPTKPVIAVQEWSPATCGGATGAPPSNMSGPELTLFNLLQSPTGGSAGPDTLTGVAKWHAQDMANSHSIGFVGSDGEDVYRRVTCSGTAGGTWIGVIAVGQSSDANAVMTAIKNDFAAYSILTAGWTFVSVGQSDGYWMIILK